MKSLRRVVLLTASAAALIVPMPQQCAPVAPAPSSPVNCRVVEDPVATDAKGVRCDAGPFDGTTQFRAVVKYRQCAQLSCVAEYAYGDWLVPPDLSIAVMLREIFPYATLEWVGWQRR